MLQHKKLGVNSLIYNGSLFGPVFGLSEKLYMWCVNTLLGKTKDRVLVLDLTWTQGFEDSITEMLDQKFDRLLIMNVLDPNYPNFWQMVNKVRSHLLFDYEQVSIFGYTDNFANSDTHRIGYNYLPNFDFWMVFEQQKDIFYDFGTRQKLYNCMMRIPKPSRFNTLCLLADADMLDEGTITFSKRNRITNQSAEDFIQFIKPKALEPKIQRGYELIKDLLPLRIDNDDVLNDGYGMNDLFTKAIQETKIDLSVETEVNFEFTQTRFVTEKIYRPICMARPFIAVAQPGTLAYLQRFGFKTFNDFWSEEYDHIDNTDHRIACAVEQLQTLKHKDQSFWNEVQAVCDHNKLHITAAVDQQIKQVEQCQW